MLTSNSEIEAVGWGINATAAEVWALCIPAPPEDVLEFGRPLDLRLYPDDAPPLKINGESMAGELVVPCWAGDKLQTLQFDPAGDRLMLPQGTLNAGYFTVGDIASSERIFIADDFYIAGLFARELDCSVVVTFDPDNTEKAAAALRKAHPEKRLVLVACAIGGETHAAHDADRADEASRIAAEVDGEWVEPPKGQSFHDCVILGTFADVLACTKRPPLRYQALTPAELSISVPMPWRVRGVLPLTGLAAMFGPSLSGKSFLALDLAAAVAGGAGQWFGRRVAQCPVTYCALEGAPGIGKRAKAWGIHHGQPLPASVHIYTQPFHLLLPSDVEDLAKAVCANGAGLVILDTLARAAPGADENSSADMSNIIAAAERLQSLTGALVLLVHHTGKDSSKGLRGHSSLFAALDGAIEVTGGDGRRKWTVAKAKDDETGATHQFRLDVVAVGCDGGGEEITSCIVTPDESEQGGARVKLPRTGNQKIALDVLDEMLRAATEFKKDGAPPSHPCIRIDDAVQRVAEGLTCEAKRRSERANQAVTALVAKKIFGARGDWMWKV